MNLRDFIAKYAIGGQGSYPPRFRRGGYESRVTRQAVLAFPVAYGAAEHQVGPWNRSRFLNARETKGKTRRTAFGPKYSIEQDLGPSRYLSWMMAPVHSQLVFQNPSYRFARGTDVSFLISSIEAITGNLVKDADERIYPVSYRRNGRKEESLVVKDGRWNVRLELQTKICRFADRWMKRISERQNL